MLRIMLPLPCLHGATITLAWASGIAADSSVSWTQFVNDQQVAQIASISPPQSFDRNGDTMQVDSVDGAISAHDQILVSFGAGSAPGSYVSMWQSPAPPPVSALPTPAAIPRAWAR
jgi:hypothetical protein